MINIIGVDCATQAKNTGLALGFFQNHTVYIEEVAIESKKNDLLDTIGEWTKTCHITLFALDAPLGWPVDLGRTLNIHKAGQPIWIEPNHLFRRKTDRFVKEKIGKQPLDVGADRIARTAHAALSILEGIRERTSHPISLAWEPHHLRRSSVIEVYPAATMLAHRIHHPGYKQKDNHQARRAIITRLRKLIEIPIVPSLIEQNADALDAVICVLAGMDFLNGTVYRPMESNTAQKEGWIWVHVPG